MEQKKIIYYPIRILLGFLIVTEVLVWLGPLDFRIPNQPLLFFYLIILNIALWWGYKTGVRNTRPSSFNIGDKAIDVLIVVGVVLNIFSLYKMWNSRGISVSLFNLINAIANPGKAYYMESDNEIASSSLFSLLLTPITTATIPIAISTWKNRKKMIKWLVVFSVFVTIAKWLGVGTRKGLIDIIIIIAFSLIAKNKQIIIDNRKRKKFRAVIVALIGLFLFYFSFSNFSRHGQDNLTEAIQATGFYNYKIFYLNNFSRGFNLVLGNVTSYLCQGYRALGLGLSMGIKPLAPFGMSWFTIAIAKKIGFDPTMNTYMFDLESYGIDMSINWHTAYLWLANDFSFIGVPLFVFFVGYFFAQSWCDSVAGKNILSFPIMTLFCIMIFYFFANNQVLSFSFIPMVVLFALYQISRKLKNN